jgi:tRNA uridine 5-carbamoylmethylation protein Kti12
MAEVLILTGPPASGKTTVARALAERYDRVAHVDVDTLRGFITPTGHVHPWGPPEAWLRQRDLSMRNACSLAGNFLEARFAVIIDDVVASSEYLDKYIDHLKPLGAPIHFVRLLPSLTICLQRNNKRGRSERLFEKRVRDVRGSFIENGEIGGVTIDNSDLTSSETADRLQALTTSGESMLWRPSMS